MAVSFLNDAFFSRLETLALNLRTDLTGFFGGKHLVKSYGQTVEFSDYREYMLGDDIRRIDWNLYSRFEKFFIKLFTDERQMHTQVFLDCSASMGKVNEKKGAYAIAVAAALGFLSVHNMDKLSFKLMKGNVSEDPFGLIVGKNSFFRTVGELEKTEYVDACDISSAVTSCTDTGAKNGLTVIISDFMDTEWKKAVDYLRYKNRQVLLIQVLTPEELDPVYNGRVNLIDSEAMDLLDDKNMKIKITKSMLLAYQQALHDMQEEIRSYCASRDAMFFSVSTEKPIEKALFGELFKTGIMS